MKTGFRKTGSWIALGILVFAAVAFFFSYPPAYVRLDFPEGRKFAFAIVDDTDGSTVENTKPVYDFLHELGIRCTKTVWVLPSTDLDHWPNRGASLADSQYLAFVLDLQSKGFEIALHGARGGHSRREEVEDALDRFENLFGYSPRIHINHSENRDNLYWGYAKLSVPPFRWLYMISRGGSRSYGHDPQSECFWGDIAKDRVTYCVNFSFHDINVFKVNPLIPYHDRAKPYVNYWFHSADGGYVTTFNELITRENVDRLEREGGVCFVYTHLASGFFRDGRLDPTFKERMEYLASRDGWFAPASEVLDYIRKNRNERDEIGFRDKVYIELRWLFEKMVHGST